MFVVDGGSAGALLDGGIFDERVERAVSPYHANVLLVFPPIAESLVPAVADVARAMPRPARAVAIAAASGIAHDVERLQGAIPGAVCVRAANTADVRRALDEVFAAAPISEPRAAPPRSTRLELPMREQQELATEWIVWSFGPIQHCTAGPLQVMAVCDGEQIVHARINTGFARRGLDEHLARTPWQELAARADGFDPDAPAVGSTAALRALDVLCRREPSARETEARDARLAADRARSTLRWSGRLLRVVGAGRWTADVDRLLRQRAPDAQLARRLAERAANDRALRLRTHVPLSTPDVMRAAGVHGPLLEAAAVGADIMDLLRLRLVRAADDLERAGGTAIGEPAPHLDALTAPVSEGSARVEVDGPRGRVGLTVTSAGGSTPSRIAWDRPSRAIIALLSDALVGKKVADAEVLIAALDPSMAEADG